MLRGMQSSTQGSGGVNDLSILMIPTQSFCANCGHYTHYHFINKINNIECYGVNNISRMCYCETLVEEDVAL